MSVHSRYTARAQLLWIHSTRVCRHHSGGQKDERWTKVLSARRFYSRVERDDRQGNSMYKGETPKPWNLFRDHCVLILICLNFSYLQSTLHLMQYTYWDFFSTAQNNFWTHGFWCLLGLLPFFLFHFFHISKMFPCEDLLRWGNKHNVVKGEIGEIGRVGHWGDAVFG